jgi:hypothetical protein
MKDVVRREKVKAKSLYFTHILRYSDFHLILICYVAF